MFSDAYDHGVVSALNELEKFAGEKFAGAVGDAVGKAKDKVVGAGKAIGDFYRPSKIDQKRRSKMSLSDLSKETLAHGDKRLKSTAMKHAVGRGVGTAAVAGGAGYGGYEALSDKKGRTKKAAWNKEAGVGEFLGGIGSKIKGGAESAWGGVKRGAGAAHDFYSPTAIAGSRRPGAESAMREGLEAQHPQTLGRDLRQLFTGHDPVGQGMAAGLPGMEEKLMSEAKRTALLRGLLTAGGAGAVGGGAYAANEYGDD